MQSELAKSTVYFDASDSLCDGEIDYCRWDNYAGALCFVDVSETGYVTQEGITQLRAKQQFHVRASDVRVPFGAAAFDWLWARLPKWRWAARAAWLPGAQAAPELGYRMLRPVRPLVSRALGRVLQLKAIGDGFRRP